MFLKSCRWRASLNASWHSAVSGTPTSVTSPRTRSFVIGFVAS